MEGGEELESLKDGREGRKEERKREGRREGVK